MNNLYLVSTPIGNLDDITLRALRVLSDVSLVAAEDTRTTRKLFARHGIKQRLVSYNEHNMNMRTPQLLHALENGDVALVSEAGTPGISDPGYELAVAAIAAGLQVIPIPGPSALVSALAVSGLPSREFTFLGFVPRRPGERLRLFGKLTYDPRTLVAFESPHRLQRTLGDMISSLGDRRIAVCRELTKVFEEIFRGRISEALKHFSNPRGEFTLVIHGATELQAVASDDAVRAELRRLQAQGVRSRDAVRQVAQQMGRPHREVYQIRVHLSTHPQ